MNVLEFANSRLWERQMESSPSGQSSYNPLARLTSSLIQPDSSSPAGQQSTSSHPSTSPATPLPTPHPCQRCEGILYYSFDPSGRPKKCMHCNPPPRLGYEQWIIAVDEGGEWICVPHWVSARRHFLMSRVESGELNLDNPPRRIDADDFALACGGWKVSEKKLEWGRAWRDKSALLRWCRTAGIDDDSAIVGVNWAKNHDAVRLPSTGNGTSVASGKASTCQSTAGATVASDGVVGKKKPSANGKSKSKSTGSSSPAGPLLFIDADLRGDEHM